MLQKLFTFTINYHMYEMDIHNIENNGIDEKLSRKVNLEIFC
jgi:hypothetical protein